MLRTRVLTGVCFGLLFLAAAWAGGGWWLALWGAVAAVGVWEYSGMLRNAGVRVAGGALLVMDLGLLVWGVNEASWSLVLPVTAVVALLGGEYNFLSAIFFLHGVLYLGFLPSFMIRLRSLGAGPAVAVFVIIWTTDTLAYFTGRFLGRRPLEPRISPKKTVEGALGGLVGAMVAAVIGGPLLGLPRAWGWLAAAGLLVGLTGQLGDLYESALKRYCGVKDSGTLLPGHGGVLDRFDSAFFAVPVWLLIGRWARWW